MGANIARVYPILFEPFPVKWGVLTGIFDRIAYTLFYKRIQLTPVQGFNFFVKEHNDYKFIVNDFNF